MMSRVLQARKPRGRVRVGKKIMIAVTLAFVCIAGLSAPALAVNQRALLEEVRFEQKLGAQAPMDAVFTDSTGQKVRLRDLLRDKPAILVPMYHGCPMLCSMVMNGLMRTLRAMELEVGEDFNLIALSFDPSEGPSEAAVSKTAYINSYGRSTQGRGWYFLTGEREQIERVCETIGFGYAYDEERQEFAHAAGIVLLSPNGTVSHYFYGVEFPPRDVRLGLVESSGNRVGSIADYALLLCYHYDPTTGQYTMFVMNSTRVGGLLTVAGLVFGIGFMIRADRRKRTLDNAPAVPDELETVRPDGGPAQI